jgi:hypothetical protein
VPHAASTPERDSAGAAWLPWMLGGALALAALAVVGVLAWRRRA